jgi:hypothetical protein
MYRLLIIINCKQTVHLVGPVVLIYYDAGQQNIRFMIHTWLRPGYHSLRKTVQSWWTQLYCCLGWPYTSCYKLVPRPVFRYFTPLGPRKFFAPPLICSYSASAPSSIVTRKLGTNIVFSIDLP